MDKEKFASRDEAIDFGKDYEYLMAAYYALTLSLNDEVNDFKMSTNNKDMGDFDDVVIEVELKNGEEHVFALQLKHFSRTIALNTLTNDNKKFSLKKYSKEFQKIKASYEKTKAYKASFKNFHFILYSNADLEKCEEISEEGRRLETVVDETKVDSHITIQKCNNCIGKNLLNLCDNDNFIYKFKTDREDSPDGEFFKQFSFYTKQKNAKEVQHLIGETVWRTFKNCNSDFVINFLNYFNYWCRRDYGAYKLTKPDVKLKLAELSLIPHIPEPDLKNLEFFRKEKMNIIHKMFCMFDIILLEEVSNLFMNKIWGVVLDELAKVHNEWSKPIPELFTHFFEPKLEIPIAARSENFSELSLKKLYILLWHKNVLPLIVKESNADQNLPLALELTKNKEKKKFIIQNEDLLRDKSDWVIFRDLSNLVEHQNIYYDNFEELMISVQGRPNISLQTFLSNDNRLCKIISFKEIVQMLEESFVIGEDCKTKFSKHYTKRLLPKIIINSTAINELQNDLFVVTYQDDIEVIKKLFRASPIETEKYLLLKQYGKAKNYIPKLLTSVDQSISEKFVIVVKGECTNEQFEEICSVNEDQNCHHVRVIEDNKVEWIQSRGNIKELQQYRENFTDSKDCVEDLQVFNYFTNKINIICADPGMGKTVMMHVLKHQCPSTHWVILIHISDHVEFFTKIRDIDEILDYFSKIEANDSFVEKVVDVFFSNQKVVFLWDGFDELHGEYADSVISAIKTLSDSNYLQWISARTSMKEYLENTFNLLSVTLTRFNMQDQYKYVYGHLKEKFDNEEEIEKTINKIDENISNSLSSGYQDYTGVPLQIHMMVEIFMNQERDDKLQFLTLTDIYQEFIQGKFNCLFQKADADLDNYHMQQIQEEFMNIQLPLYETAALKASLDESVFDTLNLNCDEFLEELSETSDSLGLIIAISNNKKPIFTHKTYEEFLTASWLVKNHQNHPHLIPIFFQEKYNDVRLMFDMLLAKNSPVHSAVLYKKLDMLEKHKDEILTSKDTAGRSALHVACAWGQRHPRINVSEKDSERSLVRRTSEENRLVYNSLLETLFGNHNMLPNKYILMKEDSFQVANKMLQRAYEEAAQLPDPVNETDKIIIYTENNARVEEEDENYLQILKFLLEHGCNPLEKDELLKWNCFQYADLTFSMAAIDIMLNYQKVDVQILKNCNHVPTLVHYGISFLYNNILDLVDEVPLIEYRFDFGDATLLQMAVETNSLYGLSKLLKSECYQKLINKEKDGPFPGNPLASSILFANMDIMNLLLENGAKVNGLKAPPLYFAAFVGNRSCCERFLEAGADVNENNSDGNSAAIGAAMNNHFDVLKLLLDYGANVNYINNFAVLHHAVFQKNLEMVKLILDHNPEINRQIEPLGYTSLHYASQFGTVEIVKCLLEHGADTKIKAENLCTPLQIALICKHKEHALELIEADPSVINEYAVEENGYAPTPLAVATLNNYDDVIELLAQKGADVYSGKNNQTPLDFAAEGGLVSTVMALIKAGASVNHVNPGDKVPLFHAVFNNLSVLKILLDNGADVNFKNKLGKTALHFAVVSGKIECVKELIERKADINAKDAKNETPLNYSIECKHLEITKYLLSLNASIENGGQLLCQAARFNFPECIPLLLEQGVGVNALDEKNCTALFYATFMGNCCVEALLINGADPNIRGDLQPLRSVHPLLLAVLFGRTKIMKELITAGAEVTNIFGSISALHFAACLSDIFSVLLLINTGADVNITDDEDRTPLHYVTDDHQLVSFLKTSMSQGNNIGLIINENKEDCAKELISQGANINCQDKNLATPLHLACIRKNTQLIKVFLQHGGDVNSLNINNHSPLHVCFAVGAINDAALLVQNGARLDQADKFGKFPTDYAMESVHLEGLPDLAVLIKLQQFGTDLDLPDKDGFTLLHKATNEGKIEIVKFLLNFGSDVDKTDNKGSSPIFYACKNNFKDIVVMLLEKSCDVNTQNVDGNAPLHFATSKESLDIIKLLCNAGSNVNVQNTLGFTPLHYLVSTDGAYEACKILIGAGAKIDQLSNKGNSPFHLAIESNQTDIVKLFMENGAEIDQKCLYHAVLADDVNILKLLHENSNQKKFDFDDLLQAVLKKYSTNVDLLQYLLQNGANPNSLTTVDDAHQCVSITALERACVLGSYDCVKCFLENGAIVNNCGEKGETPLMQAVVRKKFDIASLLIYSGAVINTRSNNGWTALFHACSQGDLSMVKFLHENGADLELQNDEGAIPLTEAVKHSSVVKYLIDNGSSVNHRDKTGATPLYYACVQSNYETALILTENEADVNMTVESNNFTPLQAAIVSSKTDSLKIVRLLLSHNADITIKSTSGNTALTNAVGSRNVDAIKLFIKELSKPQTEDYSEYLKKQWQRCLLIAAINNFADVLKLLHENGLATVNYKEDITYFTPLHFACDSGSYDAAVYLIENGADVNSKSVDGFVPLYFSTLGGHLDIIKLLVEHNAEVDAVNNHGNTSLFCAAARGYLEIVEFLYEKGAKINVIDEDGDLPLHDAAAYGHLQVVQFLMSKEADYEHKNKNGKTPLDLAIDNGRDEVVEYLNTSICICRACS